MEKPPFIKSTSASSPASGSKGKFEDRPQKSGSTNQPDGCDEKNFPNRPQPKGEPKGNPQSVPSGGKLPYSSPPKAPGKPFKLGG